jgi:hypothetical protein
VRLDVIGLAPGCSDPAAAVRTSRMLEHHRFADSAPEEPLLGRLLDDPTAGVDDESPHGTGDGDLERLVGSDRHTIGGLAAPIAQQ